MYIYKNANESLSFFANITHNSAFICALFFYFAHCFGKMRGSWCQTVLFFFLQPLLNLKCWCVQPPLCLVPHSAPCCLCVPVVLHVHVCLTLEAQLQYALLTSLWTPLMQIKIKMRRGGGQKRRTKFFVCAGVCMRVCTNRVGACSIEKWVCEHECIPFTVEDDHEHAETLKLFQFDLKRWPLKWFEFPLKSTIILSEYNMVKRAFLCSS